jgi:hypothetical protein
MFHSRWSFIGNTSSPSAREQTNSTSDERASAFSVVCLGLSFKSKTARAFLVLNNAVFSGTRLRQRNAARKTATKPFRGTISQWIMWILGAGVVAPRSITQNLCAANTIRGKVIAEQLEGFCLITRHLRQACLSIYSTLNRTLTVGSGNLTFNNLALILLFAHKAEMVSSSPSSAFR